MNENERPEFNKMIEMISTGVADSILTVHIDRLSRNRVEMGRIIQLFQKGKLKALRTPYRTYETNQDIFSLDWELIYSAQYSDRLSIRVKEGNQTKLIKGEFPGYAKIGYINQNHKIVPDPKVVPFIKYAFETYALGNVSLKTLSETLFDMGLRSQTGKKIHTSGVYRMLNNVFYIGKFTYNGNTYQGSHKPIISEELFDKVKEVHDLRNRPRPILHKDKFQFRGFLRCEVCGCAITASQHKKHNYYFCTNKKNKCEQHKRYLREDYLEVLIGNMIENITFNKEFATKSCELYLESLKKDTEVVTKSQNAILKEIESPKGTQRTLSYSISR